MSALQSSHRTERGRLPLETGDVMARAEFHRRYAMHPEIKSAELIEGVVYVASPLRARDHGFPDSSVSGWLAAYWAHQPGVRCAANSTVILDGDNEVQPDLALLRETDGTSRITPDGYIQGPPELIVEISASSTSMDLHQKKNAYRRNGVQEYIVWRVLDEAIDWFSLKDDQYVPLVPGPTGVIESAVFPGLRLDVAAMLAGDLAKVLAVQSAGG